ncbi:MAG: hypothetical protein U0X20_23715 [Caldilineaceae bacterium]
MAQIKMATGAAPATPASGYIAIYPETDGDLAILKSDGSGGALALAAHSHGTTEIADNAVTGAKLADIAANTVIGRVTAGTGDPETLDAADLVAIILGADGSGSGLDADKLDGNQATAFAASDHTHAESDSGWLTLTLNTGWATPNNGAPEIAYRKNGSLVTLRGAVRTTTSTPTLPFVTLPDGYRPAQARTYAIAKTNASNTPALYIARVGTDGVVGHVSTTYQSGDHIYVDGISFLVS